MLLLLLLFWLCLLLACATVPSLSAWLTCCRWCDNRRCRDDARCEKLWLEDHLITPVQRVLRYRLLLQDLVKKTSASHPDHDNLQKVRDWGGWGAVHWQQMHARAPSGPMGIHTHTHRHMHTHARTFVFPLTCADRHWTVLARWQQRSTPPRRILKQGLCPCKACACVRVPLCVCLG